jgi:hypothetical protein
VFRLRAHSQDSSLIYENVPKSRKTMKSQTLPDSTLLDRVSSTCIFFYEEEQFHVKIKMKHRLK